METADIVDEIRGATMATKVGRQTANVEMFRTLIDWAGGRAQFTEATGIRSGDINHIIAGRKRITKERLGRCAREIFGTPPAFVRLHEREALPATLPTALAEVSGLYALFDSAGHLLYFGKAAKLRFEINQTLNRLISGGFKIRIDGRYLTPKFRDVATHYSAYRIERGDPTFRHDVEALVLQLVVNDTLNARIGKFTR